MGGAVGVQGEDYVPACLYVGHLSSSALKLYASHFLLISGIAAFAVAN
jgi:hypothetical protein